MATKFTMNQNTRHAKHVLGAGHDALSQIATSLKQSTHEVERYLKQYDAAATAEDLKEAERQLRYTIHYLNTNLHSNLRPDILADRMVSLALAQQLKEQAE